VRTKKSTFPVVVAAAAVVVLAGCGSWFGDQGSGSGGSVTFVQGVAGDPFYETMACGARAEAEELGIDLDVQGARSWDVSLQTPLVDSVVQADPDVMFIAPNDSTGMIGPLQAAADAGIAVGLVDTSLTDTDFVDFSISTDNVAAGAAAADALAALIGEKGSVLIAGLVPGVSTSEDRAKGFIDQLAEYPDITYVGSVFTNTGGVAGISALVGAEISSTPDLVGVFAMAGDQSQGVAAAIQSAGRVGEIQVVGFDAGPSEVEQLRGGVVQALVAQDPDEIGRRAVRAASALIAGEPVEEQTGVPTSVITAADVDAPATRQYLYADGCG
jgi:ribose transport system substrate-binding protein